MRTLLVSLLAFAMITSSYGATLAIWDFGPNAAGYTEVPDKEIVIGTPTLSVVGNGYDADGQGGTSYTDDDSDSHSAGQAAKWGSGVNDGDQEWIMSLSLVGYEVNALRFDSRSTGTGPSGADLDYNIGSGWVSLSTPTFAQDSSFHAYSTAVPTAVDGVSSVQFRLSNFTGGSGSGTFVFDNLEVSGSAVGGGPAGAVPEPTSAGLMLIAAGFIIAGRKKGLLSKS